MELDITYEDIDSDTDKRHFETYNREEFKYSIIVINSKSTFKLKHCIERNICRLYQPNGTTIEMTETVTEFLHGCLPSDCIIWLCIDDPDEYIEMGYKNPYFCHIDPFGEIVTCPVGMSKINDPMFETNDRSRHDGQDDDPRMFQGKRTSPTRTASYKMFDFISENRDTDVPIKLTIKFNHTDLEYLRILVYGGRTVNEDRTMSQKEVSGVFCLDYKRSHFEMSIDKSKKFNAHDEEKVRFVNGIISFHTHPADVYDAYSVELLYPSPGDYISILTYMIQKYAFEKEEYSISPLLFSCVVTLEGIYIISINKNYQTAEQMNKLRDLIAEEKNGYFSLKQGIKDSINSKHRGISGYFYGKNRNASHYYDTHCKYIGDPHTHPLGCTQVGGFDFNTTLHNRTSDQLTHFPEACKHGAVEYSRIEQAAKDYCLKINRRELVTDAPFSNGPVLHVQFYTYNELVDTKFNIYTHTNLTEYVPPQLLLHEETISDIKLFSDVRF